MKEPYDQGVASRVGPESCGGGREATLEALTGGVRAGLLNRDIVSVRGADACLGVRKATSLVSLAQETDGPREVKDPAHARTHLTRKPGGLTLDPGSTRGPRRESLTKEQDDDERA